MNDTLPAKSRIILAVDVDSVAKARALLDQVASTIGYVKFGLEFANANGWGVAHEIAADYGLQVMADAKTKDIPNTVFGAVKSLTRHNPYFMTVMADNNLAALEQAVAGAKAGAEIYKVAEPKILGVTVLTSLSDDECEAIYGQSSETKVREFADRAKAAGFYGIVSSPKEAPIIKEIGGLVSICPGIRPLWAVSADQARPTTPADALKSGVDHMVIGRPITDPPTEIGSPDQAVKLIIKEIEEAQA